MRKGGRTRKKKNAGGYLRGPSHEQGGILASTNGEMVELEGGEYIINAQTVNALGTEFLDELNSTQTSYHQGGFQQGQLPSPSNYRQGGKIRRTKMKRGGRPAAKRMRKGGRPTRKMRKGGRPRKKMHFGGPFPPFGNLETYLPEHNISVNNWAMQQISASNISSYTQPHVVDYLLHHTGSNHYGDIDFNTHVDIADLISLIDMILSGDSLNVNNPGQRQQLMNMKRQLQTNPTPQVARRTRNMVNGMRKGGKVTHKLQRGGRPRRKKQYGGITPMGANVRSSTMNSCPPGTHMMPDGTCMEGTHHGALPGQYRKGGKTHNRRAKMRRGGRPTRRLRRGGRPIGRPTRRLGRGGRPIGRPARRLRRGGRPVARRAMRRGGNIRRMPHGGHHTTNTNCPNGNWGIDAHGNNVCV